MSNSDSFDVIVVGGGPAGSTIAWALARRGVRVAVIERAIFPREKVCGDFIEPAGVRLLERMGVREALKVASLSPITSTRIYFGPKLGFRGGIPYYQAEHGLPPHGFVVPRHILDQHLLERAQAVSANLYDGYGVGGIRREDGWIYVTARAKDSRRYTQVSANRWCGRSGVVCRQSVQGRIHQSRSHLGSTACLCRGCLGPEW
ncbi:NAD(P)/FAD-dependent oxidoreductase [Bradyrhizobium guangxiense]